MGLFSRKKAAPAAVADDTSARDATVAHLREFATSRIGVEAYVEPQTSVTQTTIMLVARDGEWTRRRVPDARTAEQLARDIGVPVYDVQRTGYPQSWRDWNARQRLLERKSATA
ncbi:oxidoreductase [Cellulomonas composti]|uniref:Uncharacterized protein n=1 Tax=Cellulomonas composti TaxID=266130 RepID=A0A511J7Z2_9CELL|nr:oxidoreductase [Cellulomonas composti]GEL93839.1 hypothetical protein CCO02nite_04970 [Cellulomonas composti]